MTTMDDTLFMPGYEAPGQARMTVAHYSHQEVIQNFEALFASLDFKAELAELGISSLHLFRRRRAVREFSALCICLWGLALEKSFPLDAARFFDHFLETSSLLNGPGAGGRELRARVLVYAELAAEKKDADFTPLAVQLVEAMALNAVDQRRLQLKLSLLLRNLYILIFDRLV